MIVKFHVIADTAKYGEYGKKNPVVLETHEFNSENEEDLETVEEYGEVDDANFEKTCRDYLIEGEIDWDQRGISYVLLTDGQLNILKKLLA
jgi:hypothetical protein